MATAIDPICQMEVDTENPTGGQSDYQGTTYYFCPKVFGWGWSINFYQVARRLGLKK